MSQQTQYRTNRRGGWILGIIAILVLIALLGGAWALANRSDQAAGLVDAQRDAQIHLTVGQPSVDCIVLTKKHFGADSVKAVNGKTAIVFDIGAWQPSDAKISSDAVNVRLTPQTAEAELATICRDPAQAAMVMNRLGAIKLGDKSVGDVNSDWIKAQGEPEVINDWAQACATDNLGDHLACQETMAKAATLLTLFKSEGMTRSNSEWNIHLANAAVVGSIPEFAMNPTQEQNAHFLTFSYTDKVLGCVSKFGFNMGITEVNGGDQRLAGLPCKEKSTPTPGSTAPAGNPTPQATPTPTPSTSKCVEPWYAGKPGYKKVGPCQWIKDTTANTWNCQQNWHNGCPGSGGWVQPPQQNTTQQQNSTQQPGTVPTNPPAPQPTQPLNPGNPPAPTSGGNNGGSTSNPVPTGTPVTGSTSTPTTNPTTCPFGGC